MKRCICDCEVADSDIQADDPTSKQHKRGEETEEVKLDSTRDDLL